MQPSSPDYTAAGCEVREDLRDAHIMILEHFRQPGSWFGGKEHKWETITRSSSLVDKA